MKLGQYPPASYDVILSIFIFIESFIVCEVPLVLFSGNTQRSFSSFGYLTCNHKDSDLYHMEWTEPLQLTARANKIEKEN